MEKNKHRTCQEIRQRGRLFLDFLSPTAECRNAFVPETSHGSDVQSVVLAHHPFSLLAIRQNGCSRFKWANARFAVFCESLWA